jgi:hypothetical protein
MNLTNTQFVFAGKTKRVLLGGMVLGVICLALSLVGDDQFHTRFWTNYLHNSVYFTGISFMTLAFLCAQITAFGGWNTAFKRIWEAMSQFIWVGIVLLSVLVIGVWGHLHHLYHWNVPGVSTPGDPNYDHLIAGKSGFLNPIWYTMGTVGVLALWYLWAVKIRKNSVEQDTNETPSLQYYKNQRKWAASFLPVVGFLVCVFVWQTVMSIDAHWYSTMFAWYSMISMLLGGISMTVMLIIYLKSKGYLEYVSRDHLHDVGKFLFGISVFWTYLWFDQFMLIWYANNGEETIYFKERMNHYPVLFWGNLLLNFITPFFILMRNSTKRKFGTMFFVAAVVFFGHWWDFFYMIKPGARISAHEAIEHAAGHSTTSHSNVAPMPHGDNHAASAAHGAESSAATSHTEDAHATATPATEAHSHPSGDTAGHAATTHHEGEHAAEAAHAHGAATAEATTAATADHAAAASHEAHGDHGHETVDPSKAFKIGFTIPGLEELGIMLGFLSLWLFFFFSQLERASLIPWRDPYLEESLHHETGALIESEQDEHHGHDDHH